MVAVVQQKRWILICACSVSIAVLLCIGRVPNVEKSLTWNVNSDHGLLLFNITTSDNHKTYNRRHDEDDKMLRETRAGQRVNLLQEYYDRSESLAVGPSPPPLIRDIYPLNLGDLEDLRAFVMFVGFGRTGHSIVGSLLDAHPDIIIAHEYSVLKKVTPTFTSHKVWLLILFNQLFRNSHKSAVSGPRCKNKDKKGYTLEVQGNSSWQGRIHTLRVIGDKSGSMTADVHFKYKDRCPRLQKELNSTLGISVRGIHIVRNPYDTVATRVLTLVDGFEALAKAKNSSKPVKRHYPGRVIDNQIDHVIQSIQRTDKLLKECPMSVKIIHLADLIYHPRLVMKDLCTALNVECYPDYLDMCEKKIFKKLSKTRYLLDWPKKQMARVSQIIRSNPEFARYSFDSD